MIVMVMCLSFRIEFSFCFNNLLTQHLEQPFSEYRPELTVTLAYWLFNFWYKIPVDTEFYIWNKF